MTDGIIQGELHTCGLRTTVLSLRYIVILHYYGTHRESRTWKMYLGIITQMLMVRVVPILGNRFQFNQSKESTVHLQTSISSVSSLFLKTKVRYGFVNITRDFFHHV